MEIIEDFIKWMYWEDVRYYTEYKDEPQFGLYEMGHSAKDLFQQYLNNPAGCHRPTREALESIILVKRYLDITKQEKPLHNSPNEATKEQGGHYGC